MFARFSHRGQSDLAVAAGDLNTLDAASAFRKRQADEQKTSLTRALIPSGHIDEEVSRGSSYGRVVAIYDGGEGKDVVV